MDEDILLSILAIIFKEETKYWRKCVLFSDDNKINLHIEGQKPQICFYSDVFLSLLLWF